MENFEIRNVSISNITNDLEDFDNSPSIVSTLMQVASNNISINMLNVSDVKLL